MIRAQSIDHAAWGFLRHRFVRALFASMLVVLAAQWAAMLVRSTLWVVHSRADQTPLSLALYLLDLIGSPIILLACVIVLSAATDWLHRRVIALMALPALACGAWAMAMVAYIAAHLLVLTGAVFALGAHVEFSPAVRKVATLVARQDLAQNLAMVAFGLFGALVMIEAALWSLWQLLASRESFLAARGWRPPVGQLISTFWRRLGLPAFLAHFSRDRIGISLLYFAVAFFNTGLIAVAITGLFLAAGDWNWFLNQLRPENGFMAITGVALVGVLAINAFGAGRLVASIANRRATRIYQAVREWDARAPVVFLRAFDQDRAKLRAVSFDPFVKLAAGVGAARTMDEILLEHASPYGPLIAIGDPRDPTPPLGAARVFVPGEDRSWQNVVSNLVTAAKAVVICPSQTEGVRWEMELIGRVGVLERAIYLGNPELSAEASTALFAALHPEAELCVKRGQRPVAAFYDPARGWRVLSAQRLSVQTVTIALNIALQALFGFKGVPVTGRNSRIG